jgi:Electron transfer DM13
MKTKILFIFCVLLLISCEVQGDLTKTIINSNQQIDPIETDQIISQGTFTATSGINVNGSTKIIIDVNNIKKVVLNDFTISSGPDLKVYLSKSNTPSEFINLGSLGNSTVFNIPENVNLSDYSYVLIHCQQYNHLFAIAQLNQN